MKNLLLAVAVIVTAGAAHADGLTFFPHPNVRDYRASMVVHWADAKPETTWRTVIQHGGWTRIEVTHGEHHSISYGNFFKNLALGASRDRSGAFAEMHLSQVDPSKDYFGLRGVNPLKDEEIVSGEHCRWSELVRQPKQPWDHSELEFRTCLTDDGIEVATKMLDYRKKVALSTQVLTLQRVPVAPSEFIPPKELFDAALWLKPLRDYPDGGRDEVDFVATMKGDESEVVLKRHYPWWSRQERGKDGLIGYKVWNVLENQGLIYSSTPGEKRLEAWRGPRDPRQRMSRFDGDIGKDRLDRRDSFLGESCVWFDMMPNMADGGHLRCLTSDGIPLKDVYTSGWGGGEGPFETVAMQRRPVTMQEMLPPPGVLDAKAWGFDLWE